ncbi:hypothetical protein LP420_36080 [Massilia sp. B-10]|nr:hypothetical protein LP420_36080 [Massilia sp. B-10]
MAGNAMEQQGEHAGEGLAQDTAAMLALAGRRRSLRWLLAAATLPLAGCDRAFGTAPAGRGQLPRHSRRNWRPVSGRRQQPRPARRGQRAGAGLASCGPTSGAAPTAAPRRRESH